MSRQILFSGVDAVGLVLLIAVLAGASVVVQAQLWLSRIGQTELIGSLLVAVIIREVGPLLVNFMLIGRSGTAIATELASMRVKREVELLDARGVEPFIYLVLPRILAMMVSSLCLTTLLVVAALGSGYIVASLMGVAVGDFIYFSGTVFESLSISDIVNFIAKTTLPGLATGAICCFEGLTIRGLITEVPQAGTRAVVRSIAALLFISAIISFFTYVR